MGEGDTDLLHVYGILKHPIRVEMLELLSGKESASFTELKRSLNIGTGKIYYHLDALGRLITQDERRRYKLTDDGRRVYRFLASSKGKLLVTGTPPAETTLDKTLGKLSLPLFPKAYVASIFDDPVRYLLVAIFIVVFGGWITMQAGLRPFVLFISPAPSPSITLFVEFVGGWLVVFLLSDLLTALLFRRTKNHLTLLAGSAIAEIPLIAYASIYYVSTRLLQIPFRILYGGVLAYGILILLQIWALCLLSTAICISKELKLDRALVISLLVFYFNVIALPFM